MAAAPPLEPPSAAHRELTLLRRDRRMLSRSAAWHPSSASAVLGIARAGERVVSRDLDT